jgi:hypothetical protein
VYLSLILYGISKLHNCCFAEFELIYTITNVEFRLFEQASVHTLTQMLMFYSSEIILQTTRMLLSFNSNIKQSLKDDDSDSVFSGS